VVSFPYTSLPKSSISHSYPMLATCPAHPILLDSITRNLFGVEYGLFGKNKGKIRPQIYVI